jgi:hypothetical protein
LSFQTFAIESRQHRDHLQRRELENIKTIIMAGNRTMPASTLYFNLIDTRTSTSTAPASSD